MHEPTLTEFRYASFVVRIWHPENGEVEGDARGWQGEVEHIQSGQRSAFASPAELWEFLHQPLAAGKGLREGVR